MSSDSTSADGEQAGPVSRRRFIGVAGGLAAGALVHTSADAVLGSPTTQEPPDPTKRHGRPANELGTRAPGEQPRRLAPGSSPAGSSRTPLQDMHGIITPADLHFERHHGGVPVIDPTEHRLLVHGMVERPLVFTLEDLKRFPAVSRIAFLECSGNGGAVYNRTPNPELSAQVIDGLTSTSEWIGVSLRTLLAEVGVRDGASWVIAEGSDSAVLSRSVPLEKCLDDAIVAYGQNGEALRPEQGYPVRLFLPGWEGNANVKWLRRLEVTDAPLHSREETSRYSDPLADGTARQFSFVMDAKSIITFPSYPYSLPEPGLWEVRGIAWTGRGRITRVEVSADGGRSWNDAELQEPVLDMCHTMFRHVWDWDGGDTVLMSRATDETGYTQPTLDVLMDARGEGSMYHWNHIRAWRVGSDGRVTAAPGNPV